MASTLGGPSTGADKKKTHFQLFVARTHTVSEKGRQLYERSSSFSTKVKAEGDALGANAQDLEKEIMGIKADVMQAAVRDELSMSEMDVLLEQLDKARSMVYEGDVLALLPHKANGPFLGLFLGSVNVVAARREMRFKVKEEYNAYRDKTALMFLGFPVCLLLLKRWYADLCVPGLPVTAYSAWLLFFYTSLALRENILRINGSDIRPWWIQHHYFAMFMSLISLSLGLEGTDCHRKQGHIARFLWWAVTQGVVMLVQNRYQRRRMYTRIALGKAGRMDVVWGESAGVKGQLYVLYPLLFGLQGFQFFVGCSMLRSVGLDLAAWAHDWQFPLLGGLLIIMALGNFWNTVATLITKARMKAKMRRKSRQVLEMSRSFGTLKDS